jgi:SpoVK/Ycf46/Vps4 family AAA+-type ATPase
MIRKISTKKTWKDVALKDGVKKELNNAINWLNQNKLPGKITTMRKEQKPLKLLFYGPSKTIKKTIASLIAKETGKEAYRIDLSEVVSKYSSETERNLEELFSKAENKNWILFFDEADALFGKRTNIKDSHDRYANQEITYLQKSIENLSGLIIFSSNTKPNRSATTLNSIHSIIHLE